VVRDADLEGKVLKILKKIDVEVNPMNIEACHRIGTKGNSIIKLSKRKDVKRIFDNKKNLKNIDNNSIGIPDGQRIYINESPGQKSWKDLPRTWKILQDLTCTKIL